MERLYDLLHGIPPSRGRFGGRGGILKADLGFLTAK
jgi:hypothetical protein